MGGKGATGPVATNDQVVQMQQKEAAQATQANQERNARLTYGAQNIKDIFEGTPSGATPLDLSAIGKTTAANPGTFTPLTATQRANLQANASQTTSQTIQDPSVEHQPGSSSFSTQQVNNSSYDPNAAAELAAGGITTGATPASDGSSGTLANGYSWKPLADDGSGTPQYGIFDGSGNLVNSGSLSDLSSSQIYTGGNAAAGTQGGFQPDFYNKYNQSILDYYLPQEGQQYNTARSSLAYGLARAGQLNSSVAGMDVGNLANQDAINRAQIASGADTQTASLRTTVQQDEQSALNQLYSTEDPSVAANTAQNMVANANLTKPLLNPSSALFNPITVGVGNAISGFTNPTAYINPSAGGVGSTVASTSSGSGSSGVNQSV